MSQISNFTLNQVREHQIHLWKGEIPVQFDIHPAEAIQSTLSAPRRKSPTSPIEKSNTESSTLKVPSLFKMVSRVSYLGTFLDEIEQYFRPYIRHQESDGVWFEFNSEPLKWNAPTGVLFDYLCAWQDEQRYETLPWKITVRFFAFPFDRVLDLRKDDDFQWNFINNLKESFFVQFNNTTPIMTSLTKLQQNEMWNAIKSGDYESFDSVYQQMMNEYFKYEAAPRKRIPCKVYRVEKNAKSKREASTSQSSTSVTSELHCVDIEDAVNHSLYSFFEERKSTFALNIIEKIIIQGIEFSTQNAQSMQILKSLKTLDAFHSFCHADQLLYITIVENHDLKTINDQSNEISNEQVEEESVSQSNAKEDNSNDEQANEHTSPNEGPKRELFDSVISMSNSMLG